MEVFDYVILLLFLFFTLIIGAYAGRGIKDIKAYAVGGRSYNAFAILATLSASYIGGGYTFGLSEKSFNHGISYGLCLLGVSLQLFLVAKYIAPRMTPFINSYSTGDIMARFYGKTGRLITGFASAIICSGIIGAQVKATGFVFNLFLGINPVAGMLIGCSIVIAYSIFGGIKAVIATDILQFVVLIVAIPLTLFCGIQYIGGIMSSADSYLNSAAIAVIHDIVKPLYQNTLTSRKELSLTRISTFIIGVLSIIFAISIESAIDILLYSYNFWALIILVPLVLGILGYQTSTKGFVICTITSVSSVIVWNMLLAEKTGFDGLVIGVLTNFITFLVFTRSKLFVFNEKATSS